MIALLNTTSSSSSSHVHDDNNKYKHQYHHLYHYHYSLLPTPTTSTRLIYLQDLSIVVSSELNDDVIDILEDEDEISAINVVCFVDDTEWDIFDLVYTEPRFVHSRIAPWKLI